MNSRRFHSITSSARASSDGGTVEAEHPGGLRIDDEFELGRLHDRQVRWLRALEDTTGVDADLTIRIRTVGSVTHQPADVRIVAVRECRDACVARRQIDQLHTTAGEEGVPADEERVGPRAHKSCKRRIDLATGAGVEDLDLQPHGPSRPF